jgi:hypothetical protein
MANEMRGPAEAGPLPSFSDRGLLYLPIYLLARVLK